jgi:class 3 adenylate cyclase
VSGNAASTPNLSTGDQRADRIADVTSGQPITRGFLFADLRGYTQFVEQHGDAAAAEYLAGYRRLVRAAVERQAGSEIRTEGDSFFVVFPSASRAVQCGLDIVAAAAAEPVPAGGEPLRVGVGVHAGETAETDEGLVGSAINIAARVCAVAAANEVLVTETVRFLTRTSLPIRFTPRGSPKLKGITEPIALYRVDAAGTVGTVAPRPSAGRRRSTAIAAAAIGTIAILAVAVIALQTLGADHPTPGSTSSPSGGLASADASAVVAVLPSPTPSVSAAPIGSSVAAASPSDDGPSPSVVGPSSTAAATPTAAGAASSAPSSGAPPSTYPAATFPTPDEAGLLAAIPPEISTACVRATQETGALADVALRCDLSLNAEADTVWWDQFATHGLVTDAMDRLARTAKLKSGTCSATVPSAYGQWQLGDTFSGRLACWQDADGAHIAWSYFDQQLVARAIRHDGDWRALYAWWKDTAGFLHPQGRRLMVSA